MADCQLQINLVKDFKGINQFIKFPFRLYQKNPYSVFPLIKERKEFFNPKKNPFFDEAKVEFILAKQRNKVVGRIAAIVNYNYIKFYHKKVGFFGFFEAFPDYHISRALFDAARDWLKREGMESIQGPVNFSTNHECGILIDGFESSPTFMMTYNPRYYPEHIEKYGFIKAKDLFAYILDLNKYQGKMEKLAERIREKRKITIRSINIKDFRNEVQRIKTVYDNAWKRNWGFVPMSDREFWWIAERLRKICVPDLCLLAEVRGEVVAFSLNLPDINQSLKKIQGRLFPLGIFKLLYYSRKINLLRGMTFGVMEKYRNLGIDLLLQEEIRRTALRMGYLKEEISWVLEDNQIVRRTLRRAGASLYKRYRIYKIAI